LNKDWNTASAWKKRRAANRLPERINPDEIKQVVELARDCERLANHYPGLKSTPKYFKKAAERAQGDEEALIAMYDTWNEYRAAIVQRFLRLNEDALRAADAVAADVFDSFLRNVPRDRIAYSKNARPIVFGGPGGSDDYSIRTWPHDLPFAAIKMPRTAFNNVQRWMALPHEVGHNIWFAIPDLASEVERLLHERMWSAVKDGKITLDPASVDLPGYRIEYAAETFVAKLWRCWASEAFADMIAVLSCGGAAVVHPLLDSADRAAKFLVKQPFEALGGKSLTEILTFTPKDQKRVDDATGRLLQGDASFARRDGTTARHALAAAVLAFERSPTDTNTVDQTFIEALSRTP
jgi:hypothetical protein